MLEVVVNRLSICKLYLIIIIHLGGSTGRH